MTRTEAFRLDMFADISILIIDRRMLVRISPGQLSSLQWQSYISKHHIPLHLKKHWKKLLVKPLGQRHTKQHIQIMLKSTSAGT